MPGPGDNYRTMCFRCFQKGEGVLHPEEKAICMSLLVLFPLKRILPQKWALFRGWALGRLCWKRHLFEKPPPGKKVKRPSSRN